MSNIWKFTVKIFLPKTVSLSLSWHVLSHWNCDVIKLKNMNIIYKRKTYRLKVRHYWWILKTVKSICKNSALEVSEEMAGQAKALHCIKRKTTRLSIPKYETEQTQNLFRRSFQYLTLFLYWLLNLKRWDTIITRLLDLFTLNYLIYFSIYSI